MHPSDLRSGAGLRPAGNWLSYRDSCGAVWGLVRSVLSATARIGMYCVVRTLCRSTSDLTSCIAALEWIVEVVLVIRVVSDLRAAPSRS